MRPYYPVSQFKQDKEKSDRENGLLLIAIVIIITFAFVIIIVANVKFNSINAIEEGNIMRENLATCKGKVVYGDGINSYVWYKGNKVFLIEGGCK